MPYDVCVRGSLPGVQWLDSHTVRFQAQSMLEVSRLLQFVTSYSPNLAP
eukprot:COSAG01_NODE_9106_length_2552_cov_1.619242_2_plen_49_part_00